MNSVTKIALQNLWDMTLPQEFGLQKPGDNDIIFLGWQNPLAHIKYAPKISAPTYIEEATFAIQLNSPKCVLHQTNMTARKIYHTDTFFHLVTNKSAHFHN